VSAIVDLVGLNSTLDATLEETLHGTDARQAFFETIVQAGVMGHVSFFDGTFDCQ